MGIRIWSDFYFDRDLTGDEQNALRAAWLKFLDDDPENIIVSKRTADTGFTGYGGMCEAFGAVRWMFPTLSGKVVSDYSECDSPGEDVDWFGPKAGELEIQYLEAEIEVLQLRVESLRKAV